MPVIGSLDHAVRFGWNHGFCAHVLDARHDGIRVIPFVRKHVPSLPSEQQCLGLGRIIHLSWGQNVIDRIPVRICNQVDLCGESAP